jgi:hypothetical protein
MKDNSHVSDVDLISYQQDLMNPQEKITFLEHISTCNYCAERLANSMTQDMITAPRYLKENIMKATKRPEVQLAHKAKQTSKQMQLFLYSLKVGTATIGALLLLFLAMNFSSVTSSINVPENNDRNNENNISFTTTIREKMDDVSNSLLDFTNNIMKTEVFNNDKKEK